MLSGINIRSRGGIKYVTTTFKNAPNFYMPSITLSNEELIKYINMGLIEGACQIFMKIFPHDINPANRSFWNLDAERIKYLTRVNDEWIIDLHGRHIFDKFLLEIRIVAEARSRAIDKDFNYDDIENIEYNFDNTGMSLCSFAVDLSNEPKNKKRVMKQVAPIYGTKLIKYELEKESSD